MDNFINNPTLKTLGTLFIGAMAATLIVYIILGILCIIFKLPYNWN